MTRKTEDGGSRSTSARRAQARKTSHRPPRSADAIMISWRYPLGVAFTITFAGMDDNEVEYSILNLEYPFSMHASIAHPTIFGWRNFEASARPGYRLAGYSGNRCLLAPVTRRLVQLNCRIAAKATRRVAGGQPRHFAWGKKMCFSGSHYMRVIPKAC